jgi:hypothetical protein
MILHFEGGRWVRIAATERAATILAQCGWTLVARDYRGWIMEYREA